MTTAPSTPRASQAVILPLARGPGLAKPFAALAMSLSCALVSPAAMASPRPGGAPSQDHLEPGLQGQSLPEEIKIGVLPRPYSKGVRLVGKSEVGGRDSNVQMTWIDHCAYISSMTNNNLLDMKKPDNAQAAGVAVIDVSDPSAPRQVGLLRDKGVFNATETMHAVSAPGRKVLAAGAYGGGHPGSKPEDAAWLDIYDVSNCAQPKLMAEYKWPENVHTVTVSANGMRVYGTHLEPFTGAGGIHVLDIADMAHPRYLGKFAATRSDGTSFEFAAHEISISPDETRIYAGVIASKGGDLNQGLAPRGPSAEGLGPEAGGIYILDNSDIALGRADPKLRLIGTVQHGGWHSVMRANIGGVASLVGAGEIGACPGAWPRIINIADETKPFIAGEFKLAMNHKENCGAPGPMAKATKGIVGDPGTASAHFNDVDSASKTRLGLFNFMWGGLRIADLRDPRNPVEVAYFKPGDACTGHVRYVPQTGDIWLTCVNNFYVLELTPQVRRSLGLPRVRSRAARP
jgi:hypothetical protein